MFNIKDYKIRDITPDDIPALHNIYSTTWLDTYPNQEFNITKEDIEYKYEQAPLPEYQGLGLGRVLWEEAKKIFDSQKDIIVHVASYNNKAINFYKKLGFVSTGKIFFDERFKMRNGAIIPELEMIIKK